MADEKKVSFAAKISRFFKDLKGEMKKIVWPSKKQIINNTGIVIAFIIILGVFIAIVDFIFNWLITLL